MPSRLAPQVAAINDSARIQAILTAAVREALEELSHYDPGPALCRLVDATVARVPRTTLCRPRPGRHNGG
jgi:hypothetical protein